MAFDRRRPGFVHHIVAVTAALADLAVLPPPAAGSQVAVPARVLERLEAEYPSEAKAAGVAGDVRFRAVVDATGRVESVEILSVPESGLGFEEAVRIRLALALLARNAAR